MRFTALFLLLVGCIAVGQKNYTLELTLNGESVAFNVEGSTTFRDKTIVQGEGQEVVTIIFEGGRLELNFADWARFDYAHVLGVSFLRTGNDTYTVNATVRHNDTGWDNYADAFAVKGDTVANGERVLLHPHENEQPFTRSQSGVIATGFVVVEAKDNVEGWGGSSVGLDLSTFTGHDEIVIDYRLTVHEE